MRVGHALSTRETCSTSSSRRSPCQPGDQRECQTSQDALFASSRPLQVLGMSCNRFRPSPDSCAGAWMSKALAP